MNNVTTKTVISKVMVVDDQVDLLELVIDDLTGFCPHLVTAQNGKEALDLMEKEPVDLILTDYLMPVMNGLDLIKNCQQKYPSVPVIMLTGNATDPKILEVLKNGYFDILEKPYVSQLLINRVQMSLLMNRLTKINWLPAERISLLGAIEDFFKLSLIEKNNRLLEFISRLNK